MHISCPAGRRKFSRPVGAKLDEVKAVFVAACREAAAAAAAGIASMLRSA